VRDWYYIENRSEGAAATGEVRNLYKGGLTLLKAVPGRGILVESQNTQNRGETGCISLSKGDERKGLQRRLHQWLLKETRGGRN